MSAATGFASGNRAHADLAVAAVRDALQRADSDYAHGVILLLSNHFNREAQAAVRAAGQTARCLQIAGGTVPGVFTEHSWALHQPAAAALVLCGDITLGPPRDNAAVMTLVTPQALQPDWLVHAPERFGALVTGGDARDSGQVWGHGRISTSGRFEGSFHQARTRVTVSRGLRFLSEPLMVSTRDAFDIFHLSHQPALDALLLAAGVAEAEELPLNHIFAAVLDASMSVSEAISEGCYTLLPILAVNPREKSVTLAAAVADDAILVWCRNDPEAAVSDGLKALTRINGHRAPAPDFALMYSCIGRGPYFYRGQDRDLTLLREHHPDVPVLGAYSAGEIAPLGPGNALLSYSAVIALVNADVQS
ncbi:MAG TPA: FIST C-terminal domain-containing protein [Rhodocyclaceae bacterium]